MEFNKNEILLSNEQNVKVKIQRIKPSKTLPNKTSLDNKLTRDAFKPYICLYCNYKSTLKDIMRNHINIQHGIMLKRHEISVDKKYEGVVREYKCTICNEQFPDKKSFHEHHVTNKSCKPFRCTHCDDKTTSEDNIQSNEDNEQIDDIKEENLNEEIEDSSLDRIIADAIEEKEDEEEEEEFCDMDPVNMEIAGTESKEVRMCDVKRNSDQIYKCKICNEQHFNKTSFDGHSLAHFRSKPFGCPHCDYRCSLKGIIKNHLQVRHGISIKLSDILPDRKKMYTREFFCKSCNKVFSYKERLYRHRSLNNDCKPFKCSYCKYRSAMKTTMKRHLKGVHKMDVSCKEIAASRTYCINNADVMLTDTYDIQSDIKEEIEATKILPELSIKQENIDNESELLNDIEIKYDITRGILLGENEVLNNFEENILYTTDGIDDESIFIDIKEEIVVDENY